MHKVLARIIQQGADLLAQSQRCRPSECPAHRGRGLPPALCYRESLRLGRELIDALQGIPLDFSSIVQVEELLRLRGDMLRLAASDNNSEHNPAVHSLELSYTLSQQDGLEAAAVEVLTDIRTSLQVYRVQSPADLPG